MTGIVTTVAGTGNSGYNGDGIQATSARINQPKGVATGPDGHVYIADDNNHRIRKVNLATGIIPTVAGSGTRGFAGEGGPATRAGLDRPRDVAVDPAGNVYIARENANRVRRVDTAGVITTAVGTGVEGWVPN